MSSTLLLSPLEAAAVVALVFAILAGSGHPVSLHEWVRRQLWLDVDFREVFDRRFARALSILLVAFAILRVIVGLLGPMPN